MLELLGLPAHCSFAFVTGCQMAGVTSLAAARHALYERLGYDLPARGLAGAPPLRVVLGAKRHVTVIRALRLLGFGSAQEQVVPADDQGRMRVEQLDAVLAADDVPTIVCVQAGEVNTGSVDDLETAVAVAHSHGAWVHVDGAFGLWAATSPSLAHLVRGHDGADSWATDAHKWLNVPYDCGIAICAHRGCTRRRWSMQPPTSRSQRPTPSATRWASAPSSPAVPALFPPGPLSARSGGEASAR